MRRILKNLDTTIFQNENTKVCYSSKVNIVWQTHLLLQSLNLTCFFFIRLHPSLSPLYTQFITTIIHCYHFFFIKFTSWRSNMSDVTNFWSTLLKYLFYHNLVSHILHSVLGTMITIFLFVYSTKSFFLANNCLWIFVPTEVQQNCLIKKKVWMEMIILLGDALY